MVHIEANLVRNTLYLKLRGFLRGEEVRELADKAIFEANRLQPGFFVINDIRDFKPTDPVSAGELQRAQTYVYNAGVRRVYRVVGDSVLGNLQFRKLQREAHANFEVVEVTEIEDAERQIAQISSC